jgi:hypothetical protein
MLTMVFVPFLSLVHLESLPEEELKALEARIQQELQIARQRVDELDAALEKVREALGGPAAD